MENKKEMTIPNVSAATDAEQSLSKCTDNSIVNQDTDFKGYEQSFEEMQREILRQLDPSYLKTVSMTTLYDTVFEVQTPLIDGLLQRGTYLFVGSPKVGKSFMMAQLAYHISTGTPLWEYKVRKATVLYFALEDDYPRLQKRLFQMFGAKETGNLYFATECKTVNGGLEEQIRGFMREHPDTGLIIIDTLKRVREAGGADYSYANAGAPYRKTLMCKSTPFLQLPSHKPEYYSFFQSIRRDYLSLIVPSHLVCRHIPLPVEETYPLLAYRLLQDNYAAFRLSAGSYITLYSVPLNALHVVSPINQSALFLLRLVL